MLIEVTRKEYEEFYREVERHKYVLSESRRFAHFSINEMAKDEDENEIRGMDILPDENVDICFEVIREIEVEQLKKALLKLKPEEYKLIKALFYEEKSVREYAEIIGKPFTTIQSKKNAIIKKLRRILKN